MPPRGYPAPPEGEPAVRVTCPICPSTNNLFTDRRGSFAAGRIKSTKYRQWCHDAGWAIQSQKHTRVLGLVAVLIEAPLARRRDVDNALKPLLDLLVDLRIIEDDNRVDDLRIVRTTEGDQMRISIWPI